jgi:flagellar brake protein
MSHTFETQPMPLGSLGDSSPGLDEFRVQSQAEILSLLRQLMDGSVLVTLTAPGGIAYTTTVWTLDSSRGTISFCVDTHTPRLAELLDADEATAVGYLDSVKVQFDIHALVLVHGPKSSVLNCELPHLVYRIQRRSSYRVRPLANSSPSARFVVPGRPDPVVLRILDVSLGGVALQGPGDFTLHPGSLLRQVEIELDADTQLQVDLRVHHATQLSSDGKAIRLGCEFAALMASDGRALQHYIDQTQKRRRLLNLQL